MKRIESGLNLSYSIKVDGKLVSQENGEEIKRGLNKGAIVWTGLSDAKARWEIEEEAYKALRLRIANFSDIEDHWAKEYLLDMFQRRVMEGMDDGSMSPDGQLTRAQASAMLMRMFEEIQPEPEEKPEAMSFTDVSGENWFYDYVKWAYEKGLVKGIGNGLFAPNKELTRQELMQMIYNELGALDLLDKGRDETEEQTADEENIEAASAWAREAVSFCLENELAHLEEDGSIAPKEAATRAEFAYMLYRVAESFIEA